MAKVLLINGSPRKNGNTFTALSEVAHVLNEQGIETEIAWIGNKAIRGCIACGSCKTKGNGQCVFNDDVCNEMIRKMNNVDGLVVGSPTYYGTPNGSVLSLIHRMLFAGADVENKPAAAVVVCRRGGASAAFQTLQMPFQMKNMPIVTSQYWNIVYGRDEGQAALDTEGMQTMRTLGNNMAWMLKSLKRDEGPEREQWQPMNYIR
ncbi:MAG: flavodoxin family protein [Prevotella sp.]|nr:flavodoxin family protein [Prevotella sp.]